MISEEELNALMVAIKNRYGLDFTNYEKGSLKRGIVRLMSKHHMDSLIELWSRVLKDQAFFANAIDDLLVNLTELFRNPAVWIKLRDDILDQYRSVNQLNVWHAGCSTGEEVYTMSIVLEEKGLLHRTRVLATDLSSRALVKARKGDYPRQLMNQYLNPLIKYFPYSRMQDYFQFEKSHATIKPRYKENVRFERHNLVTDPMHERFEIIFCRNVMIYFDDKLKTKVLDLLFQALKPGGYLIIGYYDIMPDYGKAMFKVKDLQTRIYQKPLSS